MPAPDYDALLQLPPGRALDEAIARLVGYDVPPAVAAIYFGEDNDTVMTFYANGQWYAQPAFSTDLNAAMQFVRPLVGTNPPFYLEYDTENGWGLVRSSYADDDNIVVESNTGNDALDLLRIWLTACRDGLYVPPGLAKEGDR